MSRIVKGIAGIFAVGAVAVGIGWATASPHVDVHVETEVAASADAVWAVVGQDFARVDLWTPTVESSVALDMADVPDGVTIDPDAPVAGRKTISPVLEAYEFLEDYSDEDRTFRFVGANLPPIMVSASNTTRVVELGPDRSRVSFDQRVELAGPLKVLHPLLKRRFLGTFNRVIGDLKTYVEAQS